MVPENAVAIRRNFAPDRRDMDTCSLWLLERLQEQLGRLSSRFRLHPVGVEVEGLNKVVKVFAVGQKRQINLIDQIHELADRVLDVIIL